MKVISDKYLLVSCRTGPAWAVGKLDNTIHGKNHYPADSVVCFASTYPLDTDQSRGKSSPCSEQLGPEG